MKIGADLLEMGILQGGGERDAFVDQAYEGASLVCQVSEVNLQLSEGFIYF